MVPDLSRLLAQWSHTYGSVPVRTAVTYVHLVGVLVGGGMAVAADRASLRLSPTEPDWVSQLDRLARVHRWVVTGLALVFASGVLMVLADFNGVLTSLVFWTKMGLVGLLLGNGYVRMRAESGLRQGASRGWRLFRRSSMVSLALWFGILLAGTLLHSTI